MCLAEYLFGAYLGTFLEDPWSSPGAMPLDFDDGVGAIARLGEAVVLIEVEAE